MKGNIRMMTLYQMERADSLQWSRRSRTDISSIDELK